MSFLVFFFKENSLKQNAGELIQIYLQLGNAAQVFKLKWSHSISLYDADRSIHLNEQRRQKLTETELAIMIANHFWGKLATSSCYLVDKNCTRKNGDKCFCEDESCKMTGQYGDTSVGKAFSLLKYFTTGT